MINQSGNIMHSYNSNQIERMKINKGEFGNKPVLAKEIHGYINKVLEQFSP